MDSLLNLLIFLQFASGIGSLICLIIVLTKLFPAGGVGKGVLGLICALYAFIWGWQNKDSEELNTVMIIWSIIFAVNILSLLLMGAASA